MPTEVRELAKSDQPRPQFLVETDSVLELGPGIRPMRWWQPERHELVEPYDVYVDVLRDNGVACTQATAEAYLRVCDVKEEQFETVIALDVIEHMFKPEAERVIELMKKIASKQVVIYTPKGFLPQHDDAWGLGGEYWQTHRSGWMPGEFPGWKIEISGRGFFAILHKGTMA